MLTVISFLEAFIPDAVVPDFVVINITPFLPCEPYSVAAARPFKTFTDSILLGSKSRNLEEPLLPEVKPPIAFVSLEKGTPSTTKSGWLLALKVLRPLIITLVPDPDRPP